MHIRQVRRVDQCFSVCYFIRCLVLVVEMPHERLVLLVLVLLVARKKAERQPCDTSSPTTNGKFSKADVSDLISTENQAQIKMCLAMLGREPLDTGIAQLLWRDLVKVRGKKMK